MTRIFRHLSDGFSLIDAVVALFSAYCILLGLYATFNVACMTAKKYVADSEHEIELRECDVREKCLEK